MELRLASPLDSRSLFGGQTFEGPIAWRWRFLYRVQTRSWRPSLRGHSYVGEHIGVGATPIYPLPVGACRLGTIGSEPSCRALDVAVSLAKGEDRQAPSRGAQL